MSHRPSEAALVDLAMIADELRETFAERGHHIGAALDEDSSFREGENPRSTLARALAKAGVRNGVTKVPSFSLEPAAGGGRTLRHLDRNIDRRYRVRRAKVLEDGTYLIEAKNRSILELDGDSFFREERWVFAYTLGSNDLVDEVFVAEVLDVTDGNPGRLVLGSAIALEAGLPPSIGFTPTSEGLDELRDDLDDEGGEAADLG